MGYLGKVYGDGRLRTLSALVIFAGFTGLLLAELLFGSLIFMAIGLDQFSTILLAFLFGFFILFYYTRGGHLSVIRTDEQQLFVGYLGLFSIIIWALTSGVASTDRTPIFFITLAILSIVFISWRGQIQTHEEDRITTDWSFKAENAISYLFLLMILSLIVIAIFSFSIELPKELIQQARQGISNYDSLTYLSAFIFLGIHVRRDSL